MGKVIEKHNVPTAKGKFIRDKRLELDLTIEEMAQVLRWDPAYLREMEEGHNAYITLEAQKTLYEKFGFDPIQMRPFIEPGIPELKIRYPSRR